MSTEQQAKRSAQGEPSANGCQETLALDDLAQQLSDLARALEAEDETTDVLRSLLGAAIDLIPGVEEASISVVTGRRQVESQVHSGQLSADIDRLQSETGEGPCLDSAFLEQTVRVPDLAAEERWPAFVERARGVGAESMLSFQLFVQRDTLGALNLYARTAHAFDDEAENVGQLFAAHASVALACARKRDQLEAGMATRDLIGQAKGILMERYALTGDRAFAMLTRVSRTSNVKLRDVAGELVRAREASAGRSD